MIYETNYIQHHGVKGMKWGVRKREYQKKEYGMTKKEVKSRIKAAKKKYRRQEDPYHGFSGITGKNWEKVKSEHRKAVDNDSIIKESRRKRDSAYAKAGKLFDFDSTLAEGFQIQGDVYQLDIDKRKAKIGKQYTNKYRDALLKDIGYEDIERGRRMLNDYNIDNDWGKYK